MSTPLRAIDGNVHVPDTDNPAFQLGLRIVAELQALHVKLDAITARIGDHTAAVELGHQMGYAQAVLDHHNIDVDAIADEDDEAAQ